MGKLHAKNIKVVSKDFTLVVPELEVNSGQILCVIGASGSGKSTVLNALSGFVQLDTGTVTYDDVSLDALPPEKRRIAFLFQKPALFPHLNVFENVAFGLRVQKTQKDKLVESVELMLKAFEISALANRSIYELSGGEAQRVSFARALVVGFPILFLDEPFSGLDVTLRNEIRQVLKKVVKEKGLCTILVTHDPDDVRALADRVVVLENGKVIAEGDKNSIADKTRSIFTQKFFGK